MKNIQWLIDLADKKPRLLIMALLMIAIVALSVVVVRKQDEADNCYVDRGKLQREYETRTDSLNNKHQREVNLMKGEFTDILNTLLGEYKRQIEEQKEVNKQTSSTINKNKSILNK